MTLVLTDGFELARANADLLTPVGKWTSTTGNISAVSPKTGTRSMCYNGSANTLLTRALGSDKHTKVAVGFSFDTGTGGAAHDLVNLYGDSGATEHVVVRVDYTTGRVFIDRGATEVASTPSRVYGLGHNYWEVVATLDDTVGTVNVYLNGSATPILSYTGDTKNGGTDANFDTVRLQGPIANNATFDDVYIVTGAGSAPYNDRLGEVRCWPLIPNGNGNSSQLVGNDSNSVDNYLLVDELMPAASAADYTGSAVDGNKDTYAYQNLTPTTGTVAGVTVGVCALKSDSGTKQFRNVVRSGSTDATGATKNLGTVAATYIEEFANNPVTAAAWTISEVNAAEFGFQVQP